MKYTYLGRTGVEVSRLCFGCMSFGDKSWRRWVLTEEEAMPFFRKAIEAGINFFDTADMYSVGVSEQITGKALREFARMEEVVLATKVFNKMGEGPNMRGLSRKHIQQGCEASLRRLGVETIDLYQIHRFDPHTPWEEVLSALDLLVRQGKVRYIGASSMAAWQFAQAEREMIPLCRQEGIAIIPWSPLARGLLCGTRKGVDDHSSTPRAASDKYAWNLYGQPSDEEVIRACREVAGARGVSPAQVALAWLLSKPYVTAPIIGTTKLKHLDDAIAALELELSEEEIQKLEAPYRPHEPRGFDIAAQLRDSPDSDKSR